MSSKTDDSTDTRNKVFASVLWSKSEKRYELHAQTDREGTGETQDVVRAMPDDVLVIRLEPRKGHELRDLRIQTGAFDVEPTRGRRDPDRFRIRLSQFAPDTGASLPFLFQPWVLDGEDWELVHGPRESVPDLPDECGKAVHLLMLTLPGRPPGSIIFPP